MTNQHLTVWQQKTTNGEKAAHIGSFNPGWVARRLLQELAEEGKA